MTETIRILRVMPAGDWGGTAADPRTGLLFINSGGAYYMREVTVVSN